MASHKRIDRICICIIIATLIITVLFMNGEAIGIQRMYDPDTDAYEDLEYFSAKDQNGDWDVSAASQITLKGDSAKIGGTGAYFYDGDLVISGGGYYVITGSLDDGSIIVDAHKNSKVWILLNGVSVSASDDAALRVEQADKVFLTLAEGTENTFSCGSEFSEEAVSEGRSGAVFARDDLTVNAQGDGSGVLVIEGNYRHGIKAKDDLVITGGTLNITGVSDGINVNDSFRMMNASVTITCGDDGIDQDNEGGYVYLASGGLAITSSDDAIHAEGDVTIDGGSVILDAADDGIHSNTQLWVNGGSVEITNCYEGLEAYNVTIAGGDTVIYPIDDGLNATDTGYTADAADTSGPDSSTGAEGGTVSGGGQDLPGIFITGGTLTIINETARDADGLDSNGNITITGGTTRISLTNSGTNSALDYGSENGGVCGISGGEIIACGSYSMAEGFDASSEQCAILYNFSDGAEAGTTVSLRNASGDTILSYKVPCSFSSVVMSSPDMVLGETYTVEIGGSTEEITLEEVSASYGDAASSMFGGNMNFGGMSGPGGMPGGGQEFEPGGMPGGGQDFEPDEMPDMGEMPDMSDIPELDGSMPDMGERPEFNGSMPAFGNRPDAENGESGESGFGGHHGGGRRPDFSGSMPDGEGASPAGDEASPGDEAPAGRSAAESAEEEEEAEAVSSIGTSGWRTALGLSGIVLAAGLLFAVLFREKMK